MAIESNHKLFSWIYDVIISEGGDGDAVIGFTHQDYREVARQWNLLFPDSWKMVDHGHFIEFIDNQEWIILTSKKDFDNIQNWGPRILTW